MAQHLSITAAFLGSYKPYIPVTIYLCHNFSLSLADDVNVCTLVMHILKHARYLTHCQSHKNL